MKTHIIFSARNLEEIINPFLRRILYRGKIKYSNKWILIIIRGNKLISKSNFPMLEILFGIIGVKAGDESF